jgi:hypothetical protein
VAAVSIFVLSLVAREERQLDLQLMIAVACDRSSECIWTCAFCSATWVVSPTAKPTMIWKPIYLPVPVASSMV